MELCPYLVPELWGALGAFLCPSIVSELWGALATSSLEMGSYALTWCQNSGERWHPSIQFLLKFSGLLSFQCLGLQGLWSFKVDSLFSQSINFSRFGDKRMRSSMLFDKGAFQLLLRL